MRIDLGLSRLGASKFTLTHREILLLIFIYGLLIRLIIAPYTTYQWINTSIMNEDWIFYFGFNPLAWNTTFGLGYYIFFIPAYIPFLVLNYFGISNGFFLNFLFKVPTIIGDIILFYALYEITYHITHNKRTSLTVSAVFFLNPFTIFLSSVMGQIDMLMLGFLTLAILNLLKGKLGISSFCLALSASFKFVPIFVLPAFLIFLWREKCSLAPLGKFFAVFAASLAALFSPYLLVALHLYTISQPASVTYLNNWFMGTVATGVVESQLGIYLFGFFSILAKLGYLTYLTSLLHYNIIFFTFIPTYIATTAYVIKSRWASARLIIGYPLIILALAQVAVPIGEIQFFTWVLPFILIEVFAYRKIPKFYVFILSVTVLIIHPLLSFNPYYWFVNTFPEALRPLEASWPLITANGLKLANSFGVLYTLFLTLIIFLVINPKPINPTIGGLTGNPIANLPFAAYTLIFTGIFATELFITASGITPEFLAASLIALSGLVLAFFWGTIYRGKELSFTSVKLLPNRLSMAIASLYLAAALTALFLDVLFSLANPFFLFVLVVVLGCLFVVNKRTVWALNLQRVASVFTVVYVLYTLLTAQNTPTTTAATAVLVLWFALQFLIERGGGS